MAFGIDDFFLTIAAGVNLSDTLVRTVRDNSKGKEPGDIPALIAVVRHASLKDINEAREALEAFSDLLKEKRVDLDSDLLTAIERTSFWNPVQRYRLGRMQGSIETFRSSLYNSCDDIAALVTCMGETGPMGAAIVESSQVKREFREMFRNTKSLREMIEILHDQLNRHEQSLRGS